MRERDRLRTLFDITNALVARLQVHELFPAIAAQVSNLIPHDYSMLTLCNRETGGLDLYALHATGPLHADVLKGPFKPEGMPAAEVLATGKPLAAYHTDIDRYPSPLFRQFVGLGLRSICSIPLIARDRIIGTLAFCRMYDAVWTSDDLTFLMQIASQIAIAVENSLAYRELAENERAVGN